MVQYHISPKSQRPNICKAQKGKCPLGGEHFGDKESARVFVEKKLEDEVVDFLSGHRKNSLVDASVLKPDESKIYITVYKYNPTAESLIDAGGPRANSAPENIDPDCGCYQGCNRCIIVTDFELDQSSVPNPEAILRNISGMADEDAFPKSLEAIGRKYRLDELESYEVYGEYGYYGEETEVRHKESVELNEEIADWKKRNTISHEERGKIFLTENHIDPRCKTEKEAFSEFLKNNQVSPSVLPEGEIKSSFKNVKLSEITPVDKNKYDRAIKSNRYPFYVSENAVSGVLVDNGSGYSLLIGEGFVKNERARGLQRKKFLVLESE